MKNFFKKLAFVLALAMVVTALAPAATASAAKAPVLNTTSKKLYLDGDKTGKYSEKFTLKVWNKGDYRVTFASDNTAIATVSKWYGVVEAKAVGTATITATVSNKETGKVVTTLAAKVWVKKNADSIAFGSLKAFDQPLVVGDKVKINVARKAGDVTAWKQADKSQITDYVVWTSSNTDVATVDKWGTVKAIAPGEATISAVATQIEDKLATTEPVSVKVTVVAKGITEVTQKTATKLEVTFGGAQDTTKVTKDTLVITPADTTKANPIVKSVTWNDDKTVATVEVYIALEDKVVYTVSVKDTDSKKDFTASVGSIATVTITGPTTVAIGDLAKVNYELKDANGVLLTNDNSKVTLKIIDNETNGYIDTKDGAPAVAIFEKGKSITIQLEYHTGTYNEADGTEITYKSNAYTVTAVDPADATIGTTKVTVVKGDYAKANFDNANTQITLGDFAYAIEAYVKDSAAKEYKTDAEGIVDFEFESMDRTKVDVDSLGNLYPIATGTAYIKVTVKPINKSFMISVTVAAQAKVASLTFDKAIATVTNVDGSVSFKATIKDQYGKDFDYTLADSNIDYVVSGADSAVGKLTFDGKTIKVDVSDVTTEQSIAFKVTVGDYSRILRVNVKAATDEVRKQLVVSTNSVDIARNDDNSKAVEVTVKLYGLDKNGYKAKEYKDTEYTVDITGPQTATGSSLKLVSLDGSELKKVAKVGTYTFTAKIGTDVVGKAVVVVTDSQVKPVVKQEATVIAASDLSKAFSATTANKSSKVEIIGHKGYEVGGSTTTPAAIESLSGATRYVITSVSVKETFADGNYMIHEVAVNRPLTTK